MTLCVVFFYNFCKEKFMQKQPYRFKNDDERKAMAEAALMAKHEGIPLYRFCEENGITRDTVSKCIKMFFPTFNACSGRFDKKERKEAPLVMVSGNGNLAARENIHPKRMSVKYHGAEIEFDAEDLPKVLAAIRSSEHAAL